MNHVMLYIEDDDNNISLVKALLKRRPQIELQVAMNGRDGIKAAIDSHPALILLDLHLPDLNGDQVLNELKADPVTAGIPVIVLSADASRGVIRRLLAGGAFAYLTKPIELAELGKQLDICAAARAQQPATRIAPA